MTSSYDYFSARGCVTVTCQSVWITAKDRKYNRVAQNSPRVVERELREIKLNKQSDLTKLHGQTQLFVTIVDQ